MALDKKIFGNKTLSDLFEEIYNNSRKKDKQISALVSELKDLIEGVDDATLVVPMIKEYLEIAVKNDKHLIDMASIVQRLENGTGKSGSDMFDPSEIQAILDELDQPVSKPSQNTSDQQQTDNV
jgi:hypothetical protein